MIPDDDRVIKRGVWECRNGHLNPDSESTCERCEGKKYVFPRENEAVRAVTGDRVTKRQEHSDPRQKHAGMTHFI